MPENVTMPKRNVRSETPDIKRQMLNLLTDLPLELCQNLSPDPAKRQYAQYVISSLYYFYDSYAKRGSLYHLSILLVSVVNLLQTDLGGIPDLKDLQEKIKRLESI